MDNENHMILSHYGSSSLFFSCNLCFLLCLLIGEKKGITHWLDYAIDFYSINGKKKIV